MGSHAIVRARALASEDDDSRIVMDAVRRIVQELRRSSVAAEKSVGLSGAQLFVLQKLADCRATEGTLSLSDLAARTLTDQSSVSVVAQKLVDLGLVSRKPSPTDRRRAQLSLTARGRAHLRRAPQPAQKRLLEGLARLRLAQRRALAVSLTALVEAMKLQSPTSPEMFLEDSHQG